MRFIFLGTGTSAGVPLIGCECGTCRSDDPRDVRTRTGAALTWEDGGGSERVALLDTTPDLRQQALRHGLRRCDGIFYTHNHVDHTFGLDEVRRFNAVMRGPIDVFAERRVMDDLRRVYPHIFERHNNVNDSFVATLIPRVIEPERAVELHGVRFTAVRLLHGRLPIVGWRVERTDGREDGLLPLAYCTDVSAVPTESWRLLAGVKTLALSALRFRKHPTHLTIDEALGVAESVGAERTFFVHMTHDVRHAEVEASLPERVRLAYDGLTLEG